MQPKKLTLFEVL